ncbi:MAG: MBL fold metallo-hydrolase [Myxococcota bacterium]
MRSSLVLLLLLAGGCHHYRTLEGGGVELAQGLAAQSVADGVWVVTVDQPYPSNALVARLGAEVLLVDAPYDDVTTAAILNWVVHELGPLPSLAVTTHAHDDRSGGNAHLRAREIPIWASELTSGRLPASLRPDESFPSGAPLQKTLGGQTFEVFFPGAGHSPDNVVVWLPGSKVLFAGCLVTGRSKLGFMGDADLDAWSGSLEKLRAYDAAKVVPGHGPVGGPELIAHTQKLVAEERAKSRR